MGGHGPFQSRRRCRGVYDHGCPSDLIAIYIAVASANVMPPWGGQERLLGTNPISIAIPAGAGDLVRSRYRHHGDITRHDQGAGSGRGTDARRLGGGPEGNPILDPNRADEGYLMPIGGYKGSGLNIALGLLAGVLNGAAFGAEVIDHRKVPGQAANTGQAMFVMRPDLFMDLDDFRAGSITISIRSEHPGIRARSISQVIWPPGWRKSSRWRGSRSARSFSASSVTSERGWGWTIGSTDRSVRRRGDRPADRVPG